MAQEFSLLAKTSLTSILLKSVVCKPALKTRRCLFRIVLHISVLSLPISSGFAATLSGIVSDMQGTNVAGAEITVQQVEANFSKSLVTKENGSYLFESLPPGIYTIRVRKSGYADLIQENLVVGRGAEAVILNLRLQSSSQLVEVRGEEELNPNVFVVKLDTNEILRQLGRRGANVRLIREFRSQENDYGATYGHPLRRVEFARPGRLLRDFRFSLYESHQNSALNARSFFTVGKLKPWRRNQFRATVTGPLFKDKMPLSFAWGGLRDKGFVNGNIQVPLADERTPRSSDPAVNAIIAKLLEGYPAELPNLPDVSRRQLNTNAVRDIRREAFSTRLDYRPRQMDQLVFEQRFLDYTEEPFELVAGQNPVTFLRAQSFHLTHVHAFSPGSLLRLSFNFDRLAVLLEVTERYKNLLAPLGIDVVPDIGVGGDFSRLGPGSAFPRRRVENRFHFAPEVTHARGKHTIAAGFKLTRFQINDLQSDQSRGGFSFTRNFGRSAVDNFLLGEPTSFSITLGHLYRGFRNWEHAFYVHDTIRVRPHWTLSLGLRYEIITAPTEVNNLTLIPYRTDANNFAPQLGFAWNPGGGRTVLRGGYGITFGTIFPLLYQRARFNPPAVQVLLVPDTDLLNPLGTGGEIKKSEMKLISPDLVAPYTHLYTLQIQRQLTTDTSLTVGYIGNRTIKLPNRVISNRAEPFEDPDLVETTGNINDRRPDPRFLQITTTVNGTISYFDALQVAVNRRMSRGLAWNAQYTFSKSISTGATTFADISTGNVSQSNELIEDMKGVTHFDTPHALTISYSYAFPWAGRWPGIASLFFRGWKLLGTTTFRSGTPTSVFTGSDSPCCGNVDGVNQPDRPNLLNLNLLGKSVDHPNTSASIFRPEYFDTHLPEGGRGNLGYNTFRIDGTHNWNVALAKDFYLPQAGGREPQLQFRAEFINLLNQPQFGAVNNRIAADTFGKITNTANRGRVIQLTLRLWM